MIISYAHNFIFFRPLKVGSSSVLQALGEYCGEKDIVNSPMPISEIIKAGRKLYGKNFNGFAPHTPPCEIRKKVKQETWNEFFKFTIVRNPWDMTVSMYWFETNGERKTFSEWLKRGSGSVYPFFHENYYFDNSGKKIADHYLRYENLEDDYKDLCKKINIPYRVLPRLKSGRRGDKRHYREYYSYSNRQKIRSIFSQTIKEFGYEF